MLEKSFQRKEITNLIEQGYILPKDIDKALKETSISPQTDEWSTFIQTLMLWLGALSLSFSFLFIVAYNWSEIGRFAQFAIVESAIIVTMVVYFKVKIHSIVSNISLVSASILLGVLLALFGQAYQTGADTWQLFFTWAMLMLPWTIIGRFSILWILWIALLNLSIILYYKLLQSFWWDIGDAQNLLWSLFIFNLLIHSIWELTLKYQKVDASDSWGIRLLTVMSATSITFLAIIQIIDTSATGSIVVIIMWILYLIAAYVIYRKLKPTLFILAMACLSAISVSITFLGHHILSTISAGGFFLLALFTVGLGTLCALWLKNLHKEWEL